MISTSTSLADQIAALVRSHVLASQPAQAKVQIKRLMRIKEAAEYLSFSEGALRQVIRRRQLPIVKIGTSIRIDMRDLDVWITNNRI